jgi:hypothetical protein
MLQQHLCLVVGNQGAYPAQLEALLRAKGIDAQVTNAKVSFETTGMMLRRIDRDVPDGTDIVILEPGGNDPRFFRTQGAARCQHCEDGAPATRSLVRRGDAAALSCL